MLTSNGVFKFKPPKYYDKLYELDCPDDFEKMKEVRKECAENKMLQDMEMSDKNYFEILADKEYAFQNRIKTLRRDKL